jgi:anti-sigma regulatory factor (Ser/Thr protein kinase)
VPTSAAEARRFVVERLREWNCAHIADAVVLLTSELVTNAVQHAGTDIGLVVSCFDNTIRVEIDDHAVDAPVPHPRAQDVPTAHGLLLVDMMSGRWGVDRHSTGKTVWFEVPA